jgi:predicted porin
VLKLYTFDIGRMTNYSDLRYKQAEINLGAKYQFTPALYVAANAGVQWFIDDDPYVYGDQDGTAYRGSLGVGYSF